MSIQDIVLFVDQTTTGNISVNFGKSGDRVVSVQSTDLNPPQDFTSSFDSTLPSDGIINQTSAFGAAHFCIALLARGE